MSQCSKTNIFPPRSSSKREAKILQDVSIENFATGGFQHGKDVQVFFHLSIALSNLWGNKRHQAYRNRPILHHNTQRRLIF